VKLILFSIAGLLLLLIVNLLFFYDPGVGNLPEPIINGYEYNGYDEKIVYQSEEFRPLTIIDSRVDEYRIDGDNLIVARRPRESNNFWVSHLSKNCEYWVIDTKKHTVQTTSDANGLHCK
jgi:hypothetical protein